MIEFPHVEWCLMCKMEYHPDYSGQLFCDMKCAEHYIRRGARAENRLKLGYPQYDHDIDDLHVKMR